MIDYSRIPAYKRQICTDRMLTNLHECGRTNNGNKPIYKCGFCGRTTTDGDSKCYPLSQDLRGKKNSGKKFRDRKLMDGKSERDAYAEAIS